MTTRPRPVDRRRVAIWAAPLALALALAGCAATAGTGDAPESSLHPASTEFLTDLDLAGLDARAVIDRLEAVPVDQRDTRLTASVRPGELLLEDAAGREASLPMPSDAFYLSVAPYLSETHECHFHSLTTCRGELGDSAVHVTVTDEATGRTVLDQDMTTADNGFVGLWLPRDLDGVLTVEHDGALGTSAISTSAADDATCLTGLRLR